MTHACDPGMQEAEARASGIEGKPGLQSETLFRQIITTEPQPFI